MQLQKISFLNIIIFLLLIVPNANSWTLNNISSDEANENANNEVSNLLDSSPDSTVPNTGENLFDYDNPYNQYSIDESDNIGSSYINGQWLYDEFYRNNDEIKTNNPGTEIDRYDLRDYQEKLVLGNEVYGNSPYLNSYLDSLLKVRDNNEIEYIVKVENIQNSELTELFAKYDLEISRTIDKLNVFEIYIPVSFVTQSNINFISEARSIRGVEYLEPNIYFQSEFSPNDPEWGNQWGPQIIGMTNAWDVQFGSHNVTVAIIDTGIDYSHPDLTNNYLPLGYDWVNSDSDPMDDNGHGTHVAGTIAAGINNGIGVAGIANVSIIAEKFLDSGGYGSSVDAALAIDHAVAAGADILSNSWGGGGPSTLVEDAINRALVADVMVIASAGNDGTNTKSYPAAFPGVIAVSATDSSDNLASFSNYGDWVDIAAPGVNIYSTAPFNSYTYKSGTSMAAPHVSGLAALLMSQYSNYTSIQIESLIYETAEDLGPAGFDDTFGWGRIDAASAIFGLQDHNLKTNIISDSNIPARLNTTVFGRITNSGLENETDISYSVYINEVLQDSGILSSLNTSEYYDHPIVLETPIPGVYNITFVVDPVINETVIFNNIAIKLITALDKQLDANLNDVLAYLDQSSGIEPFSLMWKILEHKSPTELIVGLFRFTNGKSVLYENFTLNPYTREFTLWELFPYWINTTGLVLNSVFDLFEIGGQRGQVVDNSTFDYYGETFDVWVVDDGYEYIFFDQESGILLSVVDYSLEPYFESVFTNVLPNGFDLHNLRIEMDLREKPEVGERLSIDIIVQNTGTNAENSFVSLYVDQENGPVDVLLSNQSVSLSPGDFQILTFDWIPLVYDIYTLRIEIKPVIGETYLFDNYKNQVFTIRRKIDYTMTATSAGWIDATKYGTQLPLSGDSNYLTVDLPFNFSFYDWTFSEVAISTNGWLSFGNSNPYQYYSPTFPSSSYSYQYAIAPYFTDLFITNNIYYWHTSNFVVFEYYNVQHDYGGIVGSFEVILFVDGTIKFQYLQMDNVQFATIGLNLGDGIHYNNYDSYNLEGVSNFALMFEYEIPEHDLSVSLQTPQKTKLGESYIINATVTNVGTNDETNVNFELYLNDLLIDSIIISTLGVGQSSVLSYPWTALEYGNYNFTASSDLVSEELISDNNIKSFIIYLEPPLEIQPSDWLSFEWYDGSYYEIVNFTKWIVIDEIIYAEHLTMKNGDIVSTNWLELNIFTREVIAGTSWLTSTYFLYMLHSNLENGSITDWYTTQVEIIDTSTYVYNNIERDVWIGNIIAWGNNLTIDIETGIVLADFGPFKLYDTNLIIFQHEIAVNLQIPNFVKVDQTIIVNATLYNMGISDEVNIDFFLYLNGSSKSSVTIPIINSGDNVTLSYMWNTTAIGIFNFTAYGTPVVDEASYKNNNNTVMVSVRDTSNLLVGILDADGSDRPTYFTGGWANNYQPLFDGLVNSNIPTILITNEDILSGALNTLSVLILIDNAPNDAASTLVVDWWQSGGSIISFDSSISLLPWGGILPPEGKGSNGYGFYWDYGSPSTGEVVDATHPIMQGYSYGETIFGSGSDAQYFSSVMQATASGPYYHPLVKSYIGSDFDLVVAYDPIASGRVVQIWDAQHWMTNTNENMILNSIIWAVQGSVKADHEVLVQLEIPENIKLGNNYKINATVSNIGLKNETDLEVFIYVNNSIVVTEIIPSLLVDESAIVSYTWAPSVYGLYNISAYITPVFNETYLGNNLVSRMILLGERVGIIVSHGEESLFDLKWFYESHGYIVDYIYDMLNTDLSRYKLILIGEYGNFWTGSEISAIDAYLRSDGAVAIIADSSNSEFTWTSTYGLYYQGFSSSWGSTTYIENHRLTTNVQSMYFSGPSNSILYTDGISIVWDSNNINSVIGVSTQVKLVLVAEDLEYYIYNDDNEIFLLNLANWEPFTNDIQVTLDIPNAIHLGTSYLINATVINVGRENETDVILNLYLDNNLVNSTSIPSLLVDENMTINYWWTPSVNGIYNFTSYSNPVVNETYIFNNLVITILELKQPIILQPGDWFEYTLQNNTLLEFTKFLNWTINDEILYGETVLIDSFSNQIVQSGWLELNVLTGEVVNSSMEWPSIYPYIMNPNLSVNKNITWWGMEVQIIGSTIYSYHGLDRSAWIGEIQGWNDLIFIDQQTGLLLNDSFAQFEIYNTNLINLDHDISVELSIPTFIQVGKTIGIDAFIINNGLNNESNVEIFIYLDDIIVESQLISDFQKGANTTISHSWTPTYLGVYNFTAYVVPVINEVFLSNNLVTRNVTLSMKIGIITSHSEESLYDLVSFYEMQGYQVEYITDMTFTNLFEYQVILIGEFGFTWSSSDIAKIDSYLTLGGTVAIIGDQPGALAWTSSFGLYYTGISTAGGITSYVNPHKLTRGIDSMYFGNPINSIEFTNGKSLVQDPTNTASLIGISNTVRLVLITDDLEFYLGIEDNSQFMLNILSWIQYEHDLEVNIDYPSDMKIGNTYSINATVSNIGLKNETNVNIEFYLDNILVNSTGGIELLVNGSYIISYDWILSEYKTYNFTVYVIPVVNETNLLNNLQSVLIPIVPPLAVKPGDWLIYDWSNGSYQEIIEFTNWVVVDEIIRANQIRVDQFGQTIDQAWFEMDIFTRKLIKGTSWLIGTFFIYMLPSTLEFGTITNWYTQTTEVIGSQLYSYKSVLRDTWIGQLSSFYGNLTIDKDTGIVLTDFGPFRLLDTNLITFEHDLDVTLELPKFVRIDTSVLINATISNFGSNNETNIDFQLILEGSIVASMNIITLFVGENVTINYLWSPTSFGNYNFTIYATPVVNETYIINNREIILFELEPPLMVAPGDWLSFNWFDGSYYENISFGAWIIPDEIIYVDHYTMNELGEEISHNWFELNVLTREVLSGTSWFIGTHFLYILHSNLAVGTTIDWFDTQIEIIGTTSQNYKGLPRGAWIGYIAEWDENILIDQETNIILADYGAYSFQDTNLITFDHEIWLTLDIPNYNPLNSVSIVTVTITNIGLSAESSIDIELYLNRQLLSTTNFALLDVGESVSAIYQWTPITGGAYNFTAFAIPVLNEYSTINNVFTKMFSLPTISSPDDISYELGYFDSGITWIAIDDNPYNYSIYINGIMAESDGNWSSGAPINVWTGGLLEGTHTVEIFVIDIYGNQASDQVIVTVTPDVTPPSIFGLSDVIYEENSFGNILSWDVYDSFPNSYEITRDGSLIDVGSWISQSVITINIDNLDVGTHTFVLTLYDASNNFIKHITTVTVIESLNPYFISVPEDLEYESGSTENTLIWYASDLYPDTYDITIDENPVQLSIPWFDNLTISINVDGLDVGLHVVEIVVFDGSGNEAIDNVNVTVVDTIAPKIVSASEDLTFAEGAIGNIIAWVLFDINPNNFEIRRNESLINSGEWSNNNQLDVNLDYLTEGGYVFTLLGFDESGNSITSDIFVTVNPIPDNIVSAGNVLGIIAGVTSIFIIAVVVGIYIKRRQK